MHLELTDLLKNDDQAQRVQALVEQCVHCGMCLGACPTYHILGDELDSPRGRIYQIKNLLEGKSTPTEVQTHLDRCLTCRSCETACPSGVKYHEILDWGRAHIAQTSQRPYSERYKRRILNYLLSRPSLFKLLWQTGQRLRPLLPMALAHKVRMPPQLKLIKEQSTEFSVNHAFINDQSADQNQRQLILHQGCVQNALTPNTNHASIQLLTAWGYHIHISPQSGCCAAMAAHNEHMEQAKVQARNNIDAWQNLLDQNPHTKIISNASACGLQLKEYPELLRDDPLYVQRAQTMAKRVYDLSELILNELKDNSAVKSQLQTLIQALPISSKTVAYHEPCTLQHGQKLKGQLAKLLDELGIIRTNAQNTQFCCGSSGTYSLLQPSLSQQLLNQKLHDLDLTNASCILSSNVGCISHLGSKANIPVIHWIEWLNQVWHSQ